MKRLEYKYASLHVASNVEKYGTPRVSNTVLVFKPDSKHYSFNF